MRKLTLEAIQETARQLGGKCLADEYKGQLVPVLWECSEGHRWTALPRDVRRTNGTWCPVCSGNVKHTLEEAQELAINKGGKCLSDKYVSNHTPLLWECDKGHQWNASYSNVRCGTWCPKCSRVKSNIDEMREIAASKGGKCLSDTYTNVTTKLEWECSQGHRWWATPNNIMKRNSWCAKCFYESRRRKSR